MARSKLLPAAIALSIAIGVESFVSPAALATTARPPVEALKAQDVDGSDDEASDAMADRFETGPSPRGRRSFVASMLAASAAAAPLASAPGPAWAAKGAAEYDLEYYMRDLFMGNKPEGNLPASNGPPPHPPRRLKGEVLPLLLDDELQSCIPIRELSTITDIPVATLSEQIVAFRSKVAPAFRVSHPWSEESVRDEYYFDLTCYSIFRIAAVALPKDYAKRDMFVRNIGRRLLDEIVSQGLLSPKSAETLRGRGQQSLSLTDTASCIVELLDIFKSSNFCTGYRLGDKNDEERSGMKVFDELDDAEISGGGSVDCLVSVYDPSTLGGALQITGEGSRFAPDLVGPTLAAAWERVGGGATVRFESYFVDSVYRPNPKDFFPNERFYQFTIAKK